MKKILTLLVSLLMVVSLSVTASAEDLSPLEPVDFEGDYFAIKVNNDKCGYNYDAYQIFTGTPAVNNLGARYLADVEWGSGVDVSALTTALKQSFNKFSSANTAAHYAEAMEGIERPDRLAETIAKHLSSTKVVLDDVHEFENKTTHVKVEADKTTGKTKDGTTITLADYTDNGHVGYFAKIEVAKAGYYLLMNSSVPSGKAGSRVIMNVVGDINVEPKLLSAPSFHKTVGGINDSKTTTPTNGYDMNDSYDQIMAKYSSWQTTADHDVGDVVPYRLSITLPQKETLAGEGSIENYVIEIIDTMSPGLDFDKDSLKLFYGYSDSKSTQTYYTPINSEQWVSLSNYLKYSNLVMKDDHSYGVGTGVTLTEDDEVFFRTMAILENAANYDEYKAKKINKALSNADAETFKKRTIWYDYTPGNGSSNSILRIGSASINNVANLISDEADSKHIHIFYECKLNDKARVGTDGDGKDGNPNTAYLKYSSNEDTLTDTTLVKNEVYTYQLNIHKVDESSKALKGADFELLKFYKELKPAEGTMYYMGSASNYSIGNTSTKITAPANASSVSNVWVVVNPKTENTIDSNGQFTNSTFNYVGIDNGTYMLRETATPAGYNSLKKPIVFEIDTKSSSTETVNPILEQFNVKLLDGPTGVGFSTADNTVSVVQGIASANIVNYEGVQLPSTGGMGTTLFYIAGAALLVAASITVIVRKQEK